MAVNLLSDKGSSSERFSLDFVPTPVTEADFQVFALASLFLFSHFPMSGCRGAGTVAALPTLISLQSTTGIPFHSL